MISLFEYYQQQPMMFYQQPINYKPRQVKPIKPEYDDDDNETQQNNSQPTQQQSVQQPNLPSPPQEDPWKKWGKRALVAGGALAGIAGLHSMYHNGGLKMGQASATLPQPTQQQPKPDDNRTPRQVSADIQASKTPSQITKNYYINTHDGASDRAQYAKSDLNNQWSGANVYKGSTPYQVQNGTFQTQPKIVYGPNGPLVYNPNTNIYQQNPFQRNDGINLRNILRF